MRTSTKGKYKKRTSQSWQIQWLNEKHTKGNQQQIRGCTRTDRWAGTQGNAKHPSWRVKIWKNEERLRNLWDVKYTNVCIIGVPEDEKGVENLQERRRENFPNLGKETDLRVPGSIKCPKQDEPKEIRIEGKRVCLHREKLEECITTKPVWKEILKGLLKWKEKALTRSKLRKNFTGKRKLNGRRSITYKASTKIKSKIISTKIRQGTWSKIGPKHNME